MTKGHLISCNTHKWSLFTSNEWAHKGFEGSLWSNHQHCPNHSVYLSQGILITYWYICWAWDAMNCICTNVEAGLLYPKGILDLHIAALAAPEATQLPLARRVTSIEPGHPQLLPLNGYSCQALSQLMPSREIFGPPNLGVKLKIKREQHFKRISLLILGFWSLTAWKPSLVKRTRYKRPKYQNDHSSKKVHEPSTCFFTGQVTTTYEVGGTLWRGPQTVSQHL